MSRCGRWQILDGHSIMQMWPAAYFGAVFMNQLINKSFDLMLCVHVCVCVIDSSVKRWLCRYPKLTSTYLQFRKERLAPPTIQGLHSDWILLSWQIDWQVFKPIQQPVMGHTSVDKRFP